MAGRTDNFPKNGKTSPNPKTPSITGKMKPTISAKAHMPEGGKRAVKPGQWTNGGKSGSPKPDAGFSMSAHSDGERTHTIEKEKPNREQIEGGNKPVNSKGTVPRGEHHASGHREPRTHAEFHQLGNASKY